MKSPAKQTRCSSPLDQNINVGKCNSDCPPSMRSGKFASGESNFILLTHCWEYQILISQLSLYAAGISKDGINNGRPVDLTTTSIT